MNVKTDKNITLSNNFINPPSLPTISRFQEIDQLKKDYKEKLNKVEKAKNYNPIKRLSKRKKFLEEKIFLDVEPKVDEKAQEEIIKIAQDQKEEEIRKSKSNEIINENINNINNINNIKEEEENIINENENIIEDPKEGEGENPNNDDKYEDILGNLPSNYYEVGEDEININREKDKEPLNINLINTNNIISPKTISKEENLEFNSLFNAFYLVSFSKNFQFLDYYIHINADCAHEVAMAYLL